MDFFGISPFEILFVLVIALIIFGPERLPRIARNMGKAVRAFRKAAFDLTSEVSKEFNLDDEESKKKPAAAAAGQVEKKPPETGANVKS